MADVCEAIIGAALLSPLPQDGAHYFDNAVAAVTAVVDSPNHAMMAWPEYFSLYKTPGYQTAPPTRSQIDLADQIAHRHGYRFRHPRLLRSAFLHPSYPFSWEKVPCYQRLEFLGDSLLDMVCVGFLFHRFPDRDPQWLTEHKVSLSLSLVISWPQNSINPWALLSSFQRLARKGKPETLTRRNFVSDGDGIQQIPRRPLRPTRLPQTPPVQRLDPRGPDPRIRHGHPGDGARGRRRRGLLGACQEPAKGLLIVVLFIVVLSIIFARRSLVSAYELR